MLKRLITGSAFSLTVGHQIALYSYQMPIPRLVHALGDSAFGCAGQRCFAASLAITVGDAGKVFKEALADNATNPTVGNGLNEDTQMGPVISQQSKSRIGRISEDGLSEGADILVDGRQPKGKTY